MNFIDKLLKILDEKQITSYKLCKDLNISKNSINNWQNGSFPTIDKLEKIIIYLGITPYDLLELDNPNKSITLSIKEKELLKYYNEFPEELKNDYLHEFKGAAKACKSMKKKSEVSSSFKTG